MATRPTRPVAGTPRTSTTTTKKKDNKTSFWLSTQEFFKSQQFQLIAGILITVISLMTLIAYISFFFTGANDMSIIEQGAERRVMREQVTNTMGLPGAVIASWLIDSMFGIPALLPIVLIGIYALKIIFHFELKSWKWLFCTSFIVLWGAVTLGYLQALLPVVSFFRWGGALGQQIAVSAMSYIQALGLGMVLLTTLIIFLIIVII